MKTKEEILDQVNFFITPEKKQQILVAMEEYATQCQEDMSIGFAEWIAQQNIKPSCSEGMWLIIKNYDDIERRLTSKELYKIYIQSINKQD